MFGLKKPLSTIQLHRRFRLCALISIIGVITVAVFVLAGWCLQIESLKRVLPGLVEMNPLSAVSFIMIALALLLQLPERRLRKIRIIAGLLCAPIIIFGLSQLLSGFTHHDLAWDQLLFRGSLNGNRMAPNTTAAVVMIALAVITIDFADRSEVKPSQALALLAGGIALVALIGYLYKTQALYGMHAFIPMALHSAICAIALCFAILAARPAVGVMAVITSDDLGGILARRLMAITVISPILLGWLRLMAVRQGIVSDQLSNALLVMGVTAIFGSLVWVNARFLHRLDGDRQQSETVRRQAEQRYRAVVQQTTEGIYLLDAQTKRIIESNAAFQKLLGYTADEADRLTAYDIVNHPRESIDQRVAETVALGHSAKGERQYKRRDGSGVDVLANASVITFDGKSVLCTVVHDISQRKRAEREIEYKNQQLVEIAESERAALAELKRTQSQLVQTEKLAGLGQMVAGVAHEINNPLSFVSNNVAVLQRDVAAIRKLLELYQQADALVEAGNKELMEEIRDLAERIDLPYTLTNSDELMTRSREGLRRIQQIVKDLREFARLDESDLHEVDINQGIESTANIIKGTARKNQVEIQLQLQPLPPFACYPAKINQVVMNLLSNAIDASTENSKVIVRTRKLDAGAIEIQVEDHGTGIPPDKISRIFDPFYTTKPPGQGTGLGLSISYGIVQDHGGTISVESEVGKGTRFTVQLPARPTEAAPV
jgi:PAS domain S-box-containing protein